MDLFSSSTEKEKTNEPLASRMRPRNLSEYIGQEHILGKGRLLRRAIQMDQLSSVIFYGPPGTGKTTLAKVIANTTKSHFSTLNAVLAGVKELETEINLAKERRDLYGIKTILFIDEVHRWNKRQQDALLPWVENGTVILIGATTENPYFEVNAALVSRSRIFQLKKLTESDLYKIAWQAINDKERGYGKYDVSFEDGALEHLVSVSSGDARSLLNALELAVETTGDSFPPKDGEKIHITKEIAEESIQQKAVLYDKEGDYHFDVISAFIKSLRGSDPDAALYWLARMVSAGEDPRFIFRRMMILASEDVGMADPFALVFVTSCAEAFDRIGLPEGRFHLAHAAIYLSTCKKSNSSLAFFDALSDVEKEKNDEVPNHLKDASRDKEGFGHGEGYLYPHSFKDHWVSQQYMPTGLQGKIYYRPGDLGYEKQIRSEVLEKRQIQLETVVEDEFEEILTYSPGDRKRNMWIERAMGERSSSLKSQMDKLYFDLRLRRHENALVLNASSGLLLWPLMKRNPEGLSVAIVKKKEQKDIIDHYAKELDDLAKPLVIVSETKECFSKLEEGLKFSAISARNILSRLESAEEIVKNISQIMEDDGCFYLLQAVPSLSSRLSDFSALLKNELLMAEKSIYSDLNPLTNWCEKDIEKLLKRYFPSVSIEIFEQKEKRVLKKEMLSSWYENSYKAHLKEDIKDRFLQELSDKEVEFSSSTLIIRCEKKKKAEIKAKKTTEKEWEKVQEMTK